MTQPNAPSLDFANMLMDSSHRDVEPKPGQYGHAPMLVKSIDAQKRQIHFLCSSADIDRDGEIIDPQAFKDSLPGFMKNPLFMAGHVHVTSNGEPTVLGHWVDLRITDKGLEGIAEFDDEDPLAQRYWNLYRKGHQRAVSIGFLARTWEMREVKQANGATMRVRAHTSIELIEISAVAIPSNRAALARAAFSAAKAADTSSSTDELAGDGQKAITKAVKQALIELSTAGTEVSFARTLALEIVEVMRSCQDHGGDDYFGDFHEDDEQPAPSSSSKGQPTIKEILREIMPA